MDDYKINKITITLEDRGSACAVTVTSDPMLPKDYALEGNEQPCVALAVCILAALRELEGDTEDSIVGFSGMRPLK